MAVPALPAAGCTKTLRWPEVVFERRDQQRVKPQAAGQAQIAACAGHADDGRFQGPSGCPRRRARAAASGTGVAILEAQALVEARAETAVGAAARCRKEAAVDARAGFARRSGFRGTDRDSARRRPPKATALCARPRWPSKPSSSVTRP